MHDSDLPLLSLNNRDFNLFRAVIQRETGIWLRDGKNVMLASRLTRRVRHHGLSDFAAYYKRIENCGRGDAELTELINCVTTNKTSFFREKHHFDYLASTILIKQRGAHAPFKVWCAAASTGEEPYSIAMTLLEGPMRGQVGGATSSGSALHVVASDIDTEVLQRARRGIYPEESLDSVPEPFHRKYFLRGSGEMMGQVRVKPQVRSIVSFERINLMDTSWPVPGGLDAIFFRNALIYFKQETQDRFLRRMSQHLKPGGHLFLGHSEHIPWLHEIFEPLNQTIYRFRGEGAR